MLTLFLLLLPAGAALAMVHIDFDQKYFTHPQRQVWDFSIVRPDSVYHIFYHTIHVETPNAAYADTIWHATTQDLKHWNIEGPILTVGQGYWDEGALWAPDVFYDNVNQRWMLAYTACDIRMNQRIAFAFSDDLYTWTKSPDNPMVVPDPEQYVWDPDASWSNFRDPFVFERRGLYHILVTAKQDMNGGTGVLYHATSPDLETWTDVGPFFINDGTDPWRVLESPQYRLNTGKHYLLFGEFDTIGSSSIPSSTMGDWTMADRTWIDYGYAPEVDEFDYGIPIYSRITPYDDPSTGFRNYVVRLDTLQINSDLSMEPYQPNPLAEDWASWSGVANLAQPTFGDNPGMRGDGSVGLVGNGFYGSKEYFQGPLSGRGSAGTTLGDAAMGLLESDVFRISGNRMTLLVGGGYYPETCYVALVDAATDTLIFSETGNNQELMTLRQWDLRPYLGRPVYLRISDQESQAFGHINVDEIHEDFLDFSSVPGDMPAHALINHRAYPNPFNPRTRIMFNLDRDQELTVKVHDLRGRLVWSSGSIRGLGGQNEVIWEGITAEGSTAPAGTYLYSLDFGGGIRASGKISLVK